ncbi:MAG: dTDP-4-dehydrorhamnose reductase [Anaerolineae bacterium]|nr:dTDP-4-dehydrorhamnose reductase [Anaerolineae bacterium]
MRIAITGHKGQLGTVLQQVLVAEEIVGLDLPEHDITDPVSIVETVTALEPDVVVHTAAMTNVDGCEQNPDLAFRVNTLGSQNIALACSRCGAAMVHVSTNDVFDGRLDRPYYEWDTPSPRSTYARSKAAAEFYVRTLLNRFYIVRTAWLYGRGGDNFVTKIMAAADKHGAIRVVTDEVSAPTYAPDLAEAIGQLIKTRHYGIYHFTNGGICSRFDWAKKILELSGRADVPVEAITTAEWTRSAAPPLYAPILNFAGAELGITLRPWQDALQAYFDG